MLLTIWDVIYGFLMEESWHFLWCWDQWVFLSPLTVLVQVWVKDCFALGRRYALYILDFRLWCVTPKYTLFFFFLLSHKSSNDEQPPRFRVPSRGPVPGIRLDWIHPKVGTGERRSRREEEEEEECACLSLLCTQKTCPGHFSLTSAQHILGTGSSPTAPWKGLEGNKCALSLAHAARTIKEWHQIHRVAFLSVL